MTTLSDEMARLLALSPSGGGPSLEMLLEERRRIDARRKELAQNQNPYNLIGSLLGASNNFQARKENEANIEAYHAQKEAEQQRLNAARRAMAEQNPEMAAMLSADPRVAAVGAVNVKREDAARAAARARELEMLKLAQQREAATLAFNRSLYKSDYEHAQSQEAATVAHARKQADDQILSAPELQSGMDKLQVKAAPLVSLARKARTLDKLLADYAEGGKYEGLPIPGIGGVQGMVGGEPTRGGGGAGAALAGAGAAAAASPAAARAAARAADSVRGNSSFQQDLFSTRGEDFGHPVTSTPGLRRLVGGALAGQFLSSVTGQVTPGRAGAAARLVEGGDQAIFTAVQDLVGQIVKTNAGLSQTQSELETVRNSIGVGNMSPEVAFLRAYPRIKAALTEDMRLIEKTTHPQVRKMFQDAYRNPDGSQIIDPFQMKFQDLSFPQLQKELRKHDAKKQRIIERAEKQQRQPRGSFLGGNPQSSNLQDLMMQALRGYA